MRGGKLTKCSLFALRPATIWPKRRAQGIAALAVRTLIALLPGVGFTTAVQAQSYPSHLVRFIVPFPPGGGVDLVIRAAAQELSSKWGTQVIVENRPGAGGTIGTDAAFRAAPDGYTLLATVNQTITTAPYLFKSLQYDPSKLTPVTLMVQSYNFVLANPAVPANNLPHPVDLS